MTTALLRSSEAARKKRLGQYFTGRPLADLLAALADAGSAGSVLDPMAGTGDLLLASSKRGAGSAAIAAIDIDPLALARCGQQVNGCQRVEGNAFDTSTLRQLPAVPWDLVIANPPYVRYQSLAAAPSDSMHVPSGAEVRSGLVASLDAMEFLDEEDRSLFQALAANYSGLADLAVPSWILCAALVRRGGVLAMVVPESWLNRDYAIIVRYLLLRLFRITYIVEDADAKWFSEASVRTTLLIAERVDRRTSVFAWKPEDGFLRIRLSGQATGPHGLVDNLFPGNADPERAFAECARTWLIDKASVKSGFVDVQWLSLSQAAQNLRYSGSKQKWMLALESHHHATERLGKSQNFNMPPELAEWLGERAVQVGLTDLESLGASIGQGLRTGANDFFYGNIVRQIGQNTVFETSRKLGSLPVIVPTSSVLPVLRKQSELPSGYEIDKSILSGCVLALQAWALPEDLDESSAGASYFTSFKYQKMPDSLADLVRAGAAADYGDVQLPKKIWELSAVAPNIRRENGGGPALNRFWYMLPAFMPRHRPDLFIARVNHGSPKTFLNKGREMLIDANFSTVWLSDDAVIDAYAVLAILNSTWCRTALELTASVMGGGALKVEATHLRQVQVPFFDADARTLFSALGVCLSRNKDEAAEAILRDIDELMASVLLGEKPTRSQLAELHTIHRAALARRTKKD